MADGTLDVGKIAAVDTPVIAYNWWAYPKSTQRSATCAWPSALR